MNTVIATTDQVAADAYGCQLIGRTPEEIPYLKMGHERGLGTMHWRNLRVAEVCKRHGKLAGIQQDQPVAGLRTDEHLGTCNAATRQRDIGEGEVA